MNKEKKVKNKLITEAVIQEVSIVDRPANDETFFLMKSEERREMDPKEIATEVANEEAAELVAEQEAEDKFESLNKRFDALAETLEKMVDKIAETAEVHQGISEKLEKSEEPTEFCVVTADGRVIVEGVEIETASKVTRDKIMSVVETLNKVLDAAPEAQIEKIKAEVEEQLAELRDTIKKMANTATDSQAEEVAVEEEEKPTKPKCKWAGLGIPRIKSH